MKNLDLQAVASGISNPLYLGNLEATKELVDLFDKIRINKILQSENDYVKMYDDRFYTYETFDKLVESENEQTDGLTREECLEQIGISIWQLPCGWYVQSV